MNKIKKVIVVLFFFFVAQIFLFAAQVGETVRLKGYKLIPSGRPVAVVTVQPHILDAIVGDMEKGSFSGILFYVKQERASFLPERTLVKVLEFSRTTGRKLSCARVEILEGDLRGYKVWTLLNKS
jgi:hypothetical protein